MPVYITESLHKLQHPKPKQPLHAPHDLTVLSYVSRVKYNQTEPELPNLDPVGTKKIQSITDTLLYYTRKVDTTMSPSLKVISTDK